MSCCLSQAGQVSQKALRFALCLPNLPTRGCEALGWLLLLWHEHTWLWAPGAHREARERLWDLSWVSWPRSPGRAEIIHVPSGHSEQGQGEGSAPGWVPAAPLPCFGHSRTFPYWMPSVPMIKNFHTMPSSRCRNLAAVRGWFGGVGTEGKGSSAGFDLAGSTPVVPDAHLSHL